MFTFVSNRNANKNKVGVKKEKRDYFKTFVKKKMG